MKTFAASLLVTMISAAVAMAQPGRGDGPGPRGGNADDRPGMARLADDPDVTPAQRQQLKKLRMDWQEQLIDLRADMQKARLAVQRLVASETIDRNAIENALKAENQAAAALRAGQVEYWLKVREVAGPEKARQLMDQSRPPRGGEGPGPKGAPGRGPRPLEDL